MADTIKTCQVGNCDRPATGTYRYEAIDCERDDVEIYEIPACDLHRDPNPDDEFWFYCDAEDDPGFYDDEFDDLEDDEFDDYD